MLRGIPSSLQVGEMCSRRIGPPPQRRLTGGG
jgi:hypothetical protein